MSFDLVVRGGFVVDGSGAPAYRADVGVRDGSIVEIGRIRERSAQEVDAEGHFVTPGFIDGHTHLDAQVCWDPLGASASLHGVTTVLMGNCGFSVAPCREEDKDLVLRSFERAEDVPREALLAGMDWRWTSYGEYLDEVERLPKAINYAGQVGHSALRTYVMGERAFEDEATADDVTAMRDELRAALLAGAFGFTSSRSPHHFTSDGRPVASRQAGWKEVVTLVDVMADLNFGALEGVGQVTPPSESDTVDVYQQLAIDTGRTFLDGAIAKQHLWKREYWQDTARRGGRMVGFVRPKPFASMMGFRVKLPFDTLDSWRDVRSRSWDEQKAALLDPEQRRFLVQEALTRESGSMVGAEARPPEYESMYVINAGMGPWPTVAEIAEKRGVTPVDAMVDLALESDLAQLFTQRDVLSSVDDETLYALMASPYSVIAGADAGAHTAQVMDADFPTLLLGYWVREKEAFTWEEAVRMLTFDPARVWSFAGRGLVREGYAADLVVFDPARVGPDVPYAENDLPGGATRLRQNAVGIRSVIVNGNEIFENNEYTGALPGQLLRGAASKRG